MSGTITSASKLPTLNCLPRKLLLHLDFHQLSVIMTTVINLAAAAVGIISSGAVAAVINQEGLVKRGHKASISRH